MLGFLTYDLKVGVLIAVFYMFYRLMLARETFHSVNRAVLLLTALASVVLPLCVITMHETVLVSADGSGLYGLDGLVYADTASQADSQPAPTVVPWWQVAVPILFIIGMVVSLGHTLLSIVRVVLLIRRSERHPQPDGTTICVVDRPELSPFSWMKYIVMNRQDYAEANPAILAHERGHIRLRHSWDVLLVDLLTALQWPNPAMWMLRQDLRAIHEYEADGEVLSKGVNARQYQYLLITKAASIGGYSIANGISHSTLKNRITMMTRNNSRRSRMLKLLALLPIVGTALALNAETVKDYVYDEPQKQQIVKKGRTNKTVSLGSQELKVTESDKATITFQTVIMPEKSPIAGIPVSVIENGKVIQETETGDITGEVTITAPVGAIVRFTNPLTNEPHDFTVNKELRMIEVRINESDEVVKIKVHVKSQEDGKPIIGAVAMVEGSKKGSVSDMDGNFTLETNIGSRVNVSYVGYETKTVWVAKRDSYDYEIALPKEIPGQKTYDVVEEMPSFPGGIPAMMEYLARSLRYPKEAEQAGLQGRVIVTFVVEKDGSVTNPKVVKAVDPALDAEALRVVLAMPTWEPGRQDGEPVRVKYTVPVTFKLDNGPALNTPKEKASANQSPEVVAVGHQDSFSIEIDGVKTNKSMAQVAQELNPDDIVSINIDKSDPKNPVMKITTKKGNK